MSGSKMRGTQQSGSIVFWLLLVTAAMAAVLVSSWMFQGSPRANHGRLPAAADESATVAHNELKLLAAKVVSSVIVPQADTAGVSDQLIDSASLESEIAGTTLKSMESVPADLAAEQVANSVAVDRTPGVLGSVADSEVEGLVSESVIENTGDQFAPESKERIDQSEDVLGESMRTVFLQVTPTSVQTPEPDTESYTAAHAIHESSKPPHEVETYTPGATSSDSKSEDSVREATPHEIHDEVRIESAGLQFQTGSKIITEPMKPILNRVIEILSDHDDARVVVAVATNESGDSKQDLRLSQERGRSIIARLVSSGIDFSRVSLDATSGASIPRNSHIVDVQAWMLSD